MTRTIVHLCSRGKEDTRSDERIGYALDAGLDKKTQVVPEEKPSCGLLAGRFYSSPVPADVSRANSPVCYDEGKPRLAW